MQPNTSNALNLFKNQMKKLIAFLLLLAGSHYFATAQNATVKGTIVDTTNKKNLTNTVISLLRSKDSILYKFTRSKEDGSFQLNKLDTGKYELFISHDTYADYIDKLAITENNSTVDLGKIMMTLKANLLNDVTVRSQIAAIRMRGDTTEYTADSFKVRPGATVEDLLKKMPGISIDKDGKITAQGSSVEKVLVDGEEFFGDDPTIATKNLQADAIDKVQVFDKKSDQAAFTGIDDGQSKKTINLKMKEDKKKGYFGKLDLGGGLNDRWNNSAMINRFRAKKKISAYGIMSSTGKTGLNWDERGSYGGGDGMPEYNEDFGGFVFFGDGNDDFGGSNYYGQGVPKSWAGGINYSNKFDEDKQNLNGSYRFNKLNTENEGRMLSQTTLAEGQQITNDHSTSFSSKFRHSGNGTYEWNLDSSTSIKITASGYTGKNRTYNSNQTYINNEKFDTLSRTMRNTSSDGDNQNLKANMLLRKKFKKIGRTLSFNLEEQYNGSNSLSYLFANITTYNNGQRDSITDQQKKSDATANILNAKAVYTEPLSKKVFLELNYAVRSSKSNSEKLSYDKNSDDKYDKLNELYSNKYRFDVLTNTTGLALKFNGKKITASAGTDIAFQNFHQKDLLRDSAFTRNYTNFFPRANFRYKLGSNSNLSINYNGSTRQPSITQIQPVRDNSNPLVIYNGNPFLKQEFRHNINLNYNSWKVLSQRGMYVYGTFNATQNAIVTSQFTDYNTGKTTYSYINTNGNFNAYSGGGYNMKIKKLDMYADLGFNLSASRYSSFINNASNALVKNVTNTTSPGIRWGMGKDKEKKYNLYYNGNFSLNYSKSSVNASLKNNYWTMSHSVNANVQLPWKMEVNTDIDYNIRQKTALFSTNNNVFLWNAYIGRKILKNDKGLIKLYAYDILDQNKGFNRFFNNNVWQQTNYQTLTRYLMLSFVWNFSKSPAGMAPNQ